MMLLSQIVDLTQEKSRLEQRVQTLEGELIGARAVAATELARVGRILEENTKLGRMLTVSNAENKTFRRMLAIAHAGSKLYADDGELQDSSAEPFIDWKNDSAYAIEAALQTRALNRAKAEAVKEPDELVDALVRESKLQAAMEDFVRAYNLAQEGLTKTQLAEAIRQAIESGDFSKVVAISSDSIRLPHTTQQVVYLPGRELDRVKTLYNELLYAVVDMHEGENRHDAALRGIKQGGTSSGPSQESKK